MTDEFVPAWPGLYDHTPFWMHYDPTKEPDYLIQIDSDIYRKLSGSVYMLDLVVRQLQSLIELLPSTSDHHNYERDGDNSGFGEPPKYSKLLKTIDKQKLSAEILEWLDDATFLFYFANYRSIGVHRDLVGVLNVHTTIKHSLSIPQHRTTFETIAALANTLHWDLLDLTDLVHTYRDELISNPVPLARIAWLIDSLYEPLEYHKLTPASLDELRHDLQYERDVVVRYLIDHPDGVQTPKTAKVAPAPMAQEGGTSFVSPIGPAQPGQSAVVNNRRTAVAIDASNRIERPLHKHLTNFICRAAGPVTIATLGRMWPDWSPRRKSVTTDSIVAECKKWRTAFCEIVSADICDVTISETDKVVEIIWHGEIQ